MVDDLNAQCTGQYGVGQWGSEHVRLVNEFSVRNSASRGGESRVICSSKELHCR